MKHKNPERKNIEFCPRKAVQKSDPDTKKQPHLVYIGVMSTVGFLNTRGVDLWETWGHEFGNAGHLEFYVGGRNLSQEQRTILDQSQLPIHIMTNVDDGVYPPQKKSFYMVNHMIREKIDNYRWFLRGDDDLFINKEKLEAFLRSIDETKPFIFGSPGTGVIEDDLKENQVFCMGGPGMVLSRALLERLTGGRLLKCLAHLKTPHEDVEISRCIEKLTNVDCGRSTDAGHFFAEDYALRVDKRTTLSKSLSLAKDALTIHPNKQPGTQQWRFGVKLVEEVHSMLFHINQLEDREASLSIPKYNDGEWISHGTHLDMHYLDQNRGSFRQITPHLKKLMYSVYNPLLKRSEKSNPDPSYYYHKIQPQVGLLVQAKQSRLLHRFTARPIQVDGKYNDVCQLNIVMALSKRTQQIERFTKNLANLSHQCQFHLAMAVYESAESNASTITTKMKEWLGEDTTVKVSIVEGIGSFEKSAGVNLAFSQLNNTAGATLQADVDIVFDIGFVQRCQRLVQNRHRLYFPILLSTFNPDIDTVSAGQWRYWGYGMVCFHPSDWQTLGGLTETYKEWGYEDQEFAQKASRRGYEIIRAHDPGIKHVWHRPVCPTIHDESKRRMCYSAASGNVGSLQTLAQIFLNQSFVIDESFAT